MGLSTEPQYSPLPTSEEPVVVTPPSPSAPTTTTLIIGQPVSSSSSSCGDSDQVSIIKIEQPTNTTIEEKLCSSCLKKARFSVFFPLTLQILTAVFCLYYWPLYIPPAVGLFAVIVRSRVVSWIHWIVSVFYFIFYSFILSVGVVSFFHKDVLFGILFAAFTFILMLVFSSSLRSYAQYCRILSNNYVCEHNLAPVLSSISSNSDIPEINYDSNSYPGQFGNVTIVQSPVVQSATPVPAPVPTPIPQQQQQQQAAYVPYPVPQFNAYPHLAPAQYSFYPTQPTQLPNGGFYIPPGFTIPQPQQQQQPPKN